MKISIEKSGLQNIRVYEILQCTSLWNKHCSFNALPPVPSSTQHHNDGVACVVLKVGQSGTG